jgi:hypothetical protein
VPAAGLVVGDVVGVVVVPLPGTPVPAPVLTPGAVVAPGVVIVVLGVTGVAGVLMVGGHTVAPRGAVVLLLIAPELVDRPGAVVGLIVPVLPVPPALAGGLTVEHCVVGDVVDVPMPVGD